MKLKRIAASLALLGLAVFAEKAFAVNPDVMTVSVNVGGALSVDVDFGGSGAYDFGTAGISATTVSTRTIVVRNDSTALTADWTVDCSTFTANWNITTAAPGADTFRLSAQLNTTQPTAADANWDAFNATVGAQNMDATTFAGNQNADDVAAATNRNIWFKMETPTSSSASGAQTVTVTVTAVAPSTF